MIGNFASRYLCDKQKCEVDFLIVRDRKRWFLVEVELTDSSCQGYLVPSMPQGRSRIVLALGFPFHPMAIAARAGKTPARWLRDVSRRYR